MNTQNPEETQNISNIGAAGSNANIDLNNRPNGTAEKPLHPAFKVFETKADWQAEIDRILSSRLKDYKKLKEQVAEQEQFISELTEYIKQAEYLEENISEKWLEELMDLKGQYPDIDLSELLENKRFLSLLTKGTPAEDAFKLVNHDSLVESARQNEKNALLSNIRAKGERPLEVGINPRNGMMLKPDPSKFSKKELEEIGSRVMRGEKITL